MQVEEGSGGEDGFVATIPMSCNIRQANTVHIRCIQQNCCFFVSCLRWTCEASGIAIEYNHLMCHMVFVHVFQKGRSEHNEKWTHKIIILQRSQLVGSWDGRGQYVNFVEMAVIDIDRPNRKIKIIITILKWKRKKETQKKIDNNRLCALIVCDRKPNVVVYCVYVRLRLL